MLSLREKCSKAPFLEGMAGAFDLLGTGGISPDTTELIQLLKKINRERAKRNRVGDDLKQVCLDLNKAIEQYAKKIKSNK